MAFFKTFNKKTISIEDLSYISKLLDTNLSLSQTFNLIKNKNNEKILSKIIDNLNNGELIENIIKDYLPKEIKDYMVALLKTMSFSSALSLSLGFYDKRKENENRLISSIAYPCILLFVSITVLYLFDLYGMDAIFDLIKTFDVNLDVYDGIRIVLRIVIKGFYYGVLISVLLIIYFIQPKKISIFYLFASKYFPNSLITTYYSEEFISLLLICINAGYKTKESLNILMQMKSKPIVSFLAFHMDESLLEGESMKQAVKKDIYDIALSRFIKIANYTNEFSKMLESYVSFASSRIQRKMKKYTTTIQITTYSFIGIIVIFIYQILFIPMQAISSF